MRKQKRAGYTEFLMPLPQALLNFLDRILEAPAGDGLREDFMKLMNLVSGYGSARTVAVAEAFQKEFRSWLLETQTAWTAQSAQSAQNSQPAQTNRYRMIAVYGLLLTQVKREVTGIVTKPDRWFAAKITDYELTNPIFIVETNKLVEELRLPKTYKI